MKLQLKSILIISNNFFYHSLNVQKMGTQCVCHGLQGNKRLSAWQTS